MNDPSRRELLTCLLGTPLALSGCDYLRKLRRRPIPGSIRGAAVTIGHKLRSQIAAAGPDEVRRVPIAIVGGGPSGLSAAWRLERLGVKDYVVLDLENTLGGTSTYGTDGAVSYPWGAHYVPLPTRDNRALTSLLQEMDLLEPGTADSDPEGKEQHLVREPEERVFFEGRWHEGLFPRSGATPQDLADLARFQAEVDKWIEYRDASGRRAFTLPMARCSRDDRVKALDKQSAAKWLEGIGVRSERVRWYVEYACRDDYGLGLEQTSAWAVLFYFASRVPRPGAESAPFLTFPEGNGRLVKYLQTVVGERARSDSLVFDVTPDAKLVTIRVWDAAAKKTIRYEVEHAILAVPKFVLRHIFAPAKAGKMKFLDDFTYGVWLVANIHLKAQPKSPGAKPAWDNVLYDSPSLGYVVASHQTLRDYGPSVWTYYLPMTDADPNVARRRLLDLRHEAACAAILADLGRAHDGLHHLIERIDIWRWGHAMVRPTPGFVWGGARERAAEPYGRCRFAHSDLSAMALFEEAQHRGIAAAESVLEARGHQFETIL